MKENPTPETDAFSGGMLDWIKFAQKLERERDEWAALCGQYKQERDEVKEKYRFAVIHWQIGAAKMERERDEALSQRNALAASLEYIASAGITARHCEDEAKKMLALVFEKEDAK